MSKAEIFINGKPYIADTEKTLLDNITQSGTFLPHLCHNAQLESYGGCGLCLVLVDGVKKPLRACSTAVREGMRVTTDAPELEKSRKAALSLMLSDHTGDCKAPCSVACPTHQDIQGYVGLIANGKPREALELIKKDNPFPASVGRVCPHPCEEKCRRRHLEGAVSICALKRYAADVGGEYIPECAPLNGKKVAVVGGGPAGLTCAYFLAIKGYGVKVFEAQKHVGGMLRYGIPAYRLPKDILDKEIECVEKLGVEIECGAKLGVDFTVESLKSEYDAVFLGTGAWRSSMIGCPGEDADGVIGGIDMLFDVAEGKKIDIGKKVCVVGGGNTAIDTVRTAVRLGASDVTLIYRRTENEMPAEPDEIRDAKAEGVNFKFLAAPVEIINENGKVGGIKIQNMELGEADSSGRRRPVPIEGSTEIIKCDTVISAIGQKVVAEDLDTVELTAKSTVFADEKTYMTSVPGVFAAGDVINSGPDIAVKAIAGGKYAATSIDCYIKGEKMPAQLPKYCVNENFDVSVLEDIAPVKRHTVKFENPDSAKSDFREVARTFSDSEAVAEASRCLECGCSAVYECELLPLLRHYDAFSTSFSGKVHKGAKDKTHPFIVRDNAKCILCAQCVRVCREISGTENLGLFGRGFDTLPVSAFGLPLDKSECVSCGACVNVCPTGALVSKTPAEKNPPLPFSDEKYTCKLCSRNCGFTKRSVNGRTVKMIPNNLRESCSLGVFFNPVAENLPQGIDEARLERICRVLCADTDKFVGSYDEALAVAQKLKCNI